MVCLVRDRPGGRMNVATNGLFTAARVGLQATKLKIYHFYLIKP